MGLLDRLLKKGDGEEGNEFLELLSGLKGCDEEIEISKVPC